MVNRCFGRIHTRNLIFSFLQPAVSFGGTNFNVGKDWVTSAIWSLWETVDYNSFNSACIFWSVWLLRLGHCLTCLQNEFFMSGIQQRLHVTLFRKTASKVNGLEMFHNGEKALNAIPRMYASVQCMQYQWSICSEQRLTVLHWATNLWLFIF